VSLSAGKWSGQATQKAARGSARLKRMLADERLGKELLKVALKKKLIIKPNAPNYR
jgi:hypothetical protein